MSVNNHQLLGCEMNSKTVVDTNLKETESSNIVY